MIQEPMKIVILGDNKSVHIQKWIKKIAEDTSIELHVLSFDHGVKFPEVHYHPLRKITGTKLDYLLNVFRTKRYIKQIKPAVVHAHYATSYGFLGAFSGFHPYLITGWGADIFDSPNNKWMKKLLVYSFKKADAITVLSKITQTEMKKLSDKKVHLIPFGVDTKAFVPNLNKNNEIIRIGSIRTLSEKYGVRYLIEAFAELCKKHQHIQLDLVGDGPLRQSLEELAVNLGIADRVIFHGYVNQNDDFKHYISLLANFDIFAILSILDSETFGVAAVEASACGIPVVASNVGGLPEVIDDGETGVLVPPKDVHAIIAALDRLIEQEDLRKKLGENGRKKVEQVYNWDHNAQQMIDLYRSLHQNKSV